MQKWFVKSEQQKLQPVTAVRKEAKRYISPPLKSGDALRFSLLFISTYKPIRRNMSIIQA